jgi:HD-like signal output (HDOD) protein/ActR/RegA family two-component response regulator
VEEAQLIRVVFVDDEAEVLKNLQRLIFATRTKLNSSFVTTVPEAIAILGSEPVDVVVSDIRMPEVSGAEFLKTVKAQWPETIRIALADEKDASTVIASAPVAHHFLTKPLDPVKLSRLIERTAVLKKQISAEQLKDKFGKLESLPSPPRHIIELNNLLDAPEPSMNEIAQLVAEDAALSAQVLHLVNSAFFGLVSEINDLRHATSYLGIAAIRDLAVVVELSNTFHTTNPQLATSIDAINDHSQLVAGIARDLLITNTDKQNAFTAGLLHDVGLLALAMIDPENFEKVNSLSNECHCLGSAPDDLSAAEEQLIGASHANLGGYLLSMWGLSHRIVEAVALHHSPIEQGEELGLILAVHIADAVSRRHSGSTGAMCNLISEEEIERFGLSKQLSHYQPAPSEKLT